MNNIPSVKANAKKAYLFNEKAWWVDLADEWYVDTMAKWAVQQGSAVPYNGRSKERSI